ncbi:MAG: beta-L-arabinofuranosidase domain-containing protein, partial [Bacteroidales bacterium]
DYVCREIGPNEGQQVRVPGHQIAEMALAKLYTVTGEKKYLDEAKFFIDMRGRGEKGMDSYRQSHIPVIEQDEPVGHAVRAEYMYSGMADVAALTGNKIYIAAIDKIWENLVSKKLYLTGGVGARREGEAFGDAYELPNLTSYCETCAAIGNVYTNFRMFLLHGESKYIDVLERTLYNGVLSGISLDGGSFFYPNPLESDGRHHRQPWFGCACCPSNIARFIPSVAGYVYSVKDNDLFVNLYMSNNVNTSVKNGDVKLSVDTNYPWDGEVTLVLKEAPKKGFELKLRIPGWVRNEVVPSDLYTYADKVTPGYSVKVNGVEVHTMLNDGYFCIKRKWKAGDKVELSMEVIPRVVKANPLVKDNEGRIAVEKGPIVYCAEWADNPGINVREAVVDKNPSLVVKRDPNKLYGIDEIIVDGSDLVLIPYYAWNHRGAGDMSVWIRIK